MLETAGVPGAPRFPCCYSQLLNPEGVEVDFFVSHWWGHEFSRTVGALEKVASSCFTELGRATPSDVVFWICLFALNQHKAAEEVGSSPEHGPFNAALAKARHGAVMVKE